MRLLRPCQGRVAETFRCPADRLPGLRRRFVQQAGHRRRLPAEGSGWYATDFRGGSSAAPATADGAAKNGEGAKPADGAAKPADGPPSPPRAAPSRPTAAPPRPSPTRRRPAAAAAPATERNTDVRPAQMAAGRIAGHRAGGHHHRRAAMDHRHARPHAADPARGLAAGPPDRRAHSRLRRAADAGHPAGGRARWSATSWARSW